MAYIKQEWTDVVLDGAPRYKITKSDATVLDASAQIEQVTPVLTAGSPLLAARFNHMEDGIEAAYHVPLIYEKKFEPPDKVSPGYNFFDMSVYQETTIQNLSFRESNIELVLPDPLIGRSVLISINVSIYNSAGAFSSSLNSTNIRISADSPISSYYRGWNLFAQYISGDSNYLRWNFSGQYIHTEGRGFRLQFYNGLLLDFPIYGNINLTVL